jgi:hypothetical protein
VGVFETRKDHERLRDEGARLGRDLLSGHWPVTQTGELEDEVWVLENFLPPPTATTAAVKK